MAPHKTELPNYTFAQELCNSISHGIGALLALIGGPFLILKAVQSGDAYHIVSAAIFTFTILCLYTISCLYHGLRPCAGKRVLRVMDHNMVFVLIVGSYVPYTLVALREYSLAWGWTIFALVIALGIIGIVLNSVNLKKFGVFCMIDYIAMGWLIVISFYPLLKSVGFMPGVFLLLMGGIAYTIGAVLYGIGGKKNQWFHLVFHCFVIVGTLLMFLSLYFSVI